MQAQKKFGQIAFDENFQFATLQDGETKTFTKTEAAILSHFCRHPGMILSRAQLLDAVSGVGSDKLDRSIDYFINRIRNKLQDDPNDPAFIATRYGEGYIWQLKEATNQNERKIADARLGPVFGLNHISGFEGEAEQFLKDFQIQFSRQFSDELTVTADFSDTPAQIGEKCTATIGVEFSFVAENTKLDCVIRGHYLKTGKMFYIARQPIVQKGAQEGVLGVSPDQSLEFIAEKIANQIWRRLALVPSKDMPLAVSMTDAGTVFSGMKSNWSEYEQTLNAALEKDPEDHRAAIMKATNIHAKYLQDGLKLFVSGVDQRATDEDEIERLVSSSLPFIEDDPVLMITAAKLLYFVGRGYRTMAYEMAQRAHAQSTSLAATLPVIGQFQIFEGLAKSGLDALEQSMSLGATGTQFEIYLLILKLEGLAALGDQDALKMALQRLYGFAPDLQPVFDIIFGDAENPSLAAQKSLTQMPEALARGSLMFVHYLYARLLRDDEHRRNAYAAPIVLLSQKFGNSIIPDEIVSHIQGLNLLEKH